MVDGGFEVPKKVPQRNKQWAGTIARYEMGRALWSNSLSHSLAPAIEVATWAFSIGPLPVEDAMRIARQIAEALGKNLKLTHYPRLPSPWHANRFMLESNAHRSQWDNRR